MTTGKGIPYLGIDVVVLSNRLHCLLSPLITKGRAPATINGARIICRSYSGSGQDSFVLYQDKLVKGITTMLCRYKPVATLILGARKYFSVS